jgi:hypothetical protein
MTRKVSIKDAKSTLTAGGLRLSAIEDFKRKHGISEIFGTPAADFDAPLPEHFLLEALV